MTLPLPQAVSLAEATMSELRHGLKLAPSDVMQVAMTMIFLQAKSNGVDKARMVKAFEQEWDIAERGVMFAPRGPLS